MRKIIRHPSRKEREERKYDVTNKGVIVELCDVGFGRKKSGVLVVGRTEENTAES
jgi:hypothetical protein